MSGCTCLYGKIQFLTLKLISNAPCHFRENDGRFRAFLHQMLLLCTLSCCSSWPPYTVFPRLPDSVESPSSCCWNNHFLFTDSLVFPFPALPLVFPLYPRLLPLLNSLSFLPHISPLLWLAAAHTHTRIFTHFVALELTSLLTGFINICGFVFRRLTVSSVLGCNGWDV